MNTFIANNSTVIIFGLLYATLGAVSTMPKPGDARPVSIKAYEWLYDFLHLMSQKVVERNPKLASVTITPGTETIVTTPTTVTSNPPFPTQAPK